MPFVARALVPSFASGWRVLFLIGSLGGVTILFLRRGMPPSPPWLATQDAIRAWIGGLDTVRTDSIAAMEAVWLRQPWRRG